jgi:hypothetical protein
MQLKTLFILAYALGLPLPALAGMQSENYHIPTSVLSGGGAPVSSDSYQTDSTLGQSSPLMDPADPPYSSSYELHPGFWYTTEAATVPDGCLWDLDPPDGDVDGSDLADFADGGFPAHDLAEFALEFGRDDCL